MLAILAPQVGAPSEIFIKRHIDHIAPGRTVVVTREERRPADPTWASDCPVLELRDGGPLHRVQRAIGPIASSVRRLPQPTWYPTRRSKAAVREFLDTRSVGVVLAEYLDEWLPLDPALEAAGVRRFAHAHGYDVSARRLADPRWRRSFATLARWDGIITMSDRSRQALISAGLPASKLHVVPYGVEVPAVVPTHPVEDCVRVLAVGRLVAKKSPRSVLLAFARASAEARMHLDVVGDGPLRASSERLAMRLGIAQRVHFHGALPQAQVRALMLRCHVFIQHSVTDDASGDEEGLPVAILEAMACGLPVVATRHAAIPEAIEHERSGLLVAPGDIEAASRCLVRLATDSGLRASMGSTAHQRSFARFRVSEQVNAIRGILGVSDAAA